MGTNDRELGICREAFSSYFAEKILLFHCNLPSTVETVTKLEVPGPSSDPFLDYFSLLSGEEVDRVLQLLKSTTSLLDLCPS